MAEDALTLAMIARIPADGVQAFRAYEDAVLPLLAAHGGKLQRRLANIDGTIEMHLVWFPSHAHFATFRADPLRTVQAPLLQQSRATIELIEVDDASAGPGRASSEL